MRIKRLYLQAFGPFTNKEINFSESAANLHLIYGPNEAGKSSALRAMTDLRFEIPVRSPDNFVHENSKLRIAAEFIDANGATVALVRRKGRGHTLSLFDVEAGESIGSEEVAREHQLALTDGLDREDFEAMFGLNHQRLRAGGSLLLKGEGELGAALFEASAGTRGISEILSELESEAKKYFSPRGSTSMVNVAKKELDEQRRLWKQSLTRPAEWQTLNRTHEQASEILAEINRDLEVMRRNANELTELRTVAPLLQKYDQAFSVLNTLLDAPDLPVKAREQRLKAEQEIAHARSDLDKAEHDLNRCKDDLAQLMIEPRLLEHAESIEHLAAGIESYRRSHIDVREQQAAIGHAEKDLQNLVRRISPGASIEDIVMASPSDVDTAELTRHLDDITRLTDKRDSLIDRIAELDAGEKLQPGGSGTPDPGARRSLQQAIGNAQKLGDISRQTTDLERESRGMNVRLIRALSELGLASDDELRTTRPLMEAQISHVRTTLADLDTNLHKLSDEDRRLVKDIEAQTTELRKLESAGEIVTFETLNITRAHRDKGWDLIRRIYVENEEYDDERALAFDPDRPLPEAFEWSQRDADRQADLLRSDADRAARFKVSVGRIHDMEKRRSEIAEAMASHRGARQQVEQAWNHQLSEARLPLLSPEALQEWQNNRATALDASDRLAELQLEHGRLIACEQKALSELNVALQALGQSLAGSASLPVLIEQAIQWDRRATESEAERNALAKTARERNAERERSERQCEKYHVELNQHTLVVQAWCDRLLLPTDSACEVVKARLSEFNIVDRDARSLADAKARLGKTQVIIDAFEAEARELASFLDEPAPVIATDFAFRLSRRLMESREQEQKRKSLESEQTSLITSKLYADAVIEEHLATFKELCEAAGVASVDLLEEQEERANQKRHAQQTVENQRNLLIEASVRPENELRQKLAEKDIASIDADRDECQREITRLEQRQTEAREAEEQARRAMESIDTSDAAAAAREAMESAAAKYRSAIRPWARLKIAHVLLRNALNRFRDRAQAPMVASASKYFSLMTDGRYVKLVADESADVPVLIAERNDGVPVRVEEMSEGTADQLYLALRLASLELRRSPHSQMPLILDDVLITSDDKRSEHILKALAKFSEAGQVMLFTHHRHLIDLARSSLSDQHISIHYL